MWKLIFIIVTIIFFAIFFIQNMVKVPVKFIITEPIEIRLTYLLLTSFIIGCLLFMVLYVSKEATRKRDEGRKRLISEDVDDDLEDY